MKIVLINKFLYARGGAEFSTFATGELLKRKGHEVYYWGMSHPANPEYPYSEYFVKNIDYENPGNVFSRLKAAFHIVYSLESRNKLQRFLRITDPDIVHMNNIAHQLSPSIIHCIKKMGIPMVMTMRDFKLVCPAYLMFSHGKPCERCKSRSYYHCFLGRCIKDSYVKSAVNMMEMYVHHLLLDIYANIRIFIAPSRFLAEKTREMGFEGDIRYLPNFLDMERFDPCFEFREESIVYAGRLSVEKGLFTLLDAVELLPVKVKIFGDGPLKDAVIRKIRMKGLDHVELHGFARPERLFKEISRCMAVVLPSECYENNPRSIIEAFALGKPVIGARIGGIPELVRDGITGYTFSPGNADDLRDRIERILREREEIPRMGRNGRRYLERYFHSERHFGALMEIYRSAREGE